MIYFCTLSLCLCVILHLQISNFFRNTTAKVQFPGIDLLSVDVARGRDVGLQPYNRVRQLCGLPLTNDFDDLADLIHIKVNIYLLECSSVFDSSLCGGGGGY